MLTLGKHGVGLAILSVVFAPSLVLLSLNTDSLAAGQISAVLIIYFMSFSIICFKPLRAFFSWSAMLQMSVAIILLFIHYYISGFFVNLSQDHIRFFWTVLSISIFPPAAYIVANSLIQLANKDVRNLISSVFYILLINGIISLTGIDFFSTGLNKPTFLFAEPSNFAVISAPFIIYYIKLRLVGWQSALIVFLSYAIVIENLTMLLVVFITFMVCFQLKKLLLLLPFLVVIFLSFANLDYFFSRLIYSPDETDNISLVVLLTGWQNALLSLSSTSGWGVGFQQFGIASPSGELTEKLIELNGSNLNSLNGGSTGSKLVGEFGVFGIIMILILIARAKRAFSDLRLGNNMTDLFVFLKCVEIAILIELFVRGLGYFTPGIFTYLIVIYSYKLIGDKLGSKNSSRKVTV